ncbi:MAG: permease, partial [Comamonadaceae bacterium]
MNSLSSSSESLVQSRAGLPPFLVLCLAATWLVWGSTYLAIKYALLSFAPFMQMGTRFLFAGVALAAWMRWRGTAWPTRLQWRNA